MSFSQAEFADKKKITRREKFLARMEEIIPWQNLLAVIEPFYPKGERGRPPVGLERMLRMYFLQQWYGLADEALEDAIYDSQAMQGFTRTDLAGDGVPDATTLLKFRRLLETNDLCKALFTAINADLSARGPMMRPGQAKPGPVEFSIDYLRQNGTPADTTSVTTDGSRLVLLDESKLIRDVRQIAKIIDPNRSAPASNSQRLLDSLFDDNSLSEEAAPTEDWQSLKMKPSGESYRHLRIFTATTGTATSRKSGFTASRNDL